MKTEFKLLVGFCLVGAMILIGGFFTAQAQAVPTQPTEPKGYYNVCVRDQQELPVSGHPITITTRLGVIAVVTSDDGCKSEVIIAGPTAFQAGSGIVHHAVIRDRESVYEEFTYPPYQNRFPSLRRKASMERYIYLPQIQR